MQKGKGDRSGERVSFASSTCDARIYYYSLVCDDLLLANIRAREPSFVCAPSWQPASRFLVSPSFLPSFLLPNAPNAPPAATKSRRRRCVPYYYYCWYGLVKAARDARRRPTDQRGLFPEVQQGSHNPSLARKFFPHMCMTCCHGVLPIPRPQNGPASCVHGGLVRSS